MAKTKTPFLSLGSRGTVGGVLTSQKRGEDTILRKTPKPTDPYSLAQAYQRWDYRDYAYLWTLLSNSEKQVYRTRGSRYHITGFSQWMREHLKDLTNLAGRWHLDEKGGAIAYDSSRNNNNGIIVGATPTDGLIDGGFYFDGLNDLIILPNSPTLKPTIFSIEFLIKAKPDVTPWRDIITSTTDVNGNNQAYHIRIDQATGFLTCRSGDGTGVNSVTSTFALNDDLWHYVCYSNDLSTLILHIDDSFNNSTPYVLSPLFYDATTPRIGSQYGWLFGNLDHFALHSRILTTIEKLRHSQRRYPV